jgi:AcrR family transcriptional regulator
MMSRMTSGLRERRKRETRQAISDIATEMFALRGYDQVTIADIAAAAGVAKMTVTNYFPRKEDLVFDRAEAIIRHLAEVIASRAPGESLLAAVRRDYADAAARGDVTLGLSSPAFAGMIAGSPALASRGLEMLDQREQALGDAIAAETGTDTPQQRVVAALLASVHRVLYAEASRRSLAGQPRDEIRSVLADEAAAAFDLLEPALGRYLIRPALPDRDRRANPAHGTHLLTQCGVIQGGIEGGRTSRSTYPGTSGPRCPGTPIRSPGSRRQILRSADPVPVGLGTRPVRH